MKCDNASITIMNCTDNSYTYNLEDPQFNYKFSFNAKSSVIRRSPGDICCNFFIVETKK